MNKTNKAFKGVYAVINIGCLECGNDSELVAVTKDFEEAKRIANDNYPKGNGILYGEDYSAQFAEMQTVIFPIATPPNKGKD